MFNKDSRSLPGKTLFFYFYHLFKSPEVIITTSNAFMSFWSEQDGDLILINHKQDFITLL